MNEINLKKIFSEIKDSKFLLIAITFSTLLIGLLLQNFFQKIYNNETSINNYEINLKHEDILVAFESCTKNIFPSQICNYDTLIYLITKLSNHLTNNKLYFEEEFNSETLYLDELEIINLSSLSENILNNDIIKLKFTLSSNFVSEINIKKKINLILDIYLKNIKKDYEELNYNFILTELTKIKSSKFFKADYSHYQECLDINTEFKEIILCGKEKRLEYCSKLQSCTQKGNRLVYYFDALAEGVENGEMTDSSAKILFSNYLNQLINEKRRIDSTPIWADELSQIQIENLIINLKNNLKYFMVTIFFDEKNSRLETIIKNSTFNLSLYYYFIFLIIIILNLIILSYKIIKKK